MVEMILKGGTSCSKTMNRKHFGLRKGSAKKRSKPPEERRIRKKKSDHVVFLRSSGVPDKWNYRREKRRDHETQS